MSASSAQSQTSSATLQDATSSTEQSTSEETSASTKSEASSTQNESATSTQEQSSSANTASQQSTTQGNESANASTQEASSASATSATSAAEEVVAEEKSEVKTPAGSLTQTLTSADGKHYTVTLDYGADAKIPEGAALSLVEYNKELTEEERAQEANKNRPYATEKFLSAAAYDQRAFDVSYAMGVTDEDYVFFSKHFKLTVQANSEEVQPAAAVKLTVQTDAVAEDSSDTLVATVLDAKSTKKWQDGAEERAKQREALTPEEQAALPRDPSQIFTTLVATNETKAGEGTKVTFSTMQLGDMCLAGVAHELIDWEANGMRLSLFGALSTTVSVKECAAPEFVPGYMTLKAFRMDAENAPSYGAGLWLKAQPIAGAVDAAASAHKLEASTLGAELFGASGTATPVAFVSGDAFVLAREQVQTEEDNKDAADASATEKTNEPAADTEVPAANEADAQEGVSEAGGEEQASGAVATTERTITQSSDANTTSTLHNNLSTTDGAAYSVTLTYGADAGIPVGSTLEVRELTGSEYRDAQASAGENTHAVDFTAESFSVYTVAYTVDFHWGDYTYSIAGKSNVLLSELLAKLGVTEITVDDVTDVSFSDTALVKVEAEGDDWRLTSLKAFDTEEALTLTLANGQQVSIAVTDAASGYVCKITDASGNLLDKYTSLLGTHTEATTNQYPTFLCGVPGEGNQVIWGAIVAGTRRVILRKVDSAEFTSLEGAVFTLYTSDKQTVVSGGENLTSDASGVFFAGSLEYGTYYLKETTTPTGYEDNKDKMFRIDVSADGVTYPVKVEEV